MSTKLTSNLPPTAGRSAGRGQSQTLAQPDLVALWAGMGGSLFTYDGAVFLIALVVGGLARLYDQFHNHKERPVGEVTL